MARHKKASGASGPSLVERLARVEERLDSIEQSNAAGFGRMSDRLTELSDGIGKVHQRIEGAVHGDESSPGVMIRVDRLEQSQERSQWLIRAVIGALIPLIASAAYALAR